MSKTVLVACKLPCGLVLDGTGGENSIVLNGMNTALLPGAPGLTHVDEDDWLYVKAAYAEHAAFKSNSVFASGSDKVADTMAQAAELRDERTGFEGLDPKSPSARVKPHDEQKLDAQIALNQTATPRIAVEGADLGAALEVATSAKAKPAAKPAAKGKGK